MAADVGADPASPALSPAEFHLFCALRQTRHPAAMTTLSTHDTKRSEDVRARLAALTELPEEWAAAVAGWQARADELARAHGSEEPASGEEQYPDAELKYLLWQTLVACWPIDEDRLLPYLTKAVREAKVHTSWTAPNDVYEAAVLDFTRLVLNDGELRGEIERFAGRVTRYAAANCLAQKLLQLTMTGVPDVYQGSEIDFQALVDPDNRRPVDFSGLASRLDALDASEHESAPGVREEFGAPGRAALSDAKLLVVSRTLRLRREHPEWFGARANQTPLFSTGPATDHVLAFLRGERVAAVATRLPVTLDRLGGWRGTAIALPAGTWRCALTGQTYEMGSALGDELPLERLTAALPVALLVRQDEQ